MNRFATLGPRLAFLIALGVSGALLAQAAWRSVTGYHSNYSLRAELPPGEPLTNRLLLVVLDGIRVDVARQMPFLERLARRGSSGTVRTGAPSLSNPSRAVISTGAWQEIHGVTHNGLMAPPAVDSIFSLAKRQGLPQAAAGSDFWVRAFGAYLGDQVKVYPKATHMGAGPRELIEFQQDICRQTTDFLAPRPSGLLVAGLTAADSAGHDFGGRSEQYLQVARAVDACLESLIGAVDDGQTTFVVTSDHGHIDWRGQGGHGGSEDEVLDVPLVMAGQAIRSSGGWRAQQVDIAPTICALLGLPLPATNQGRILWEALEAPVEIESALRAREAQQRDIATAQLPDRDAGLQAERRGRSLSALAAFTFFWYVGCAIVLRQRSNWRWLLLSVAAYYLAYYLLFWGFGLQYSLSAIGRQEYLGNYLLRDILAAGLALALASVLLARFVERFDAPLLLDFALLVSTTIALQLTAIHYWFGLFMEGFMVDLSWSFKACLDLLQLPGIAIAAPLVAAASGLVRRPKQVPAPVESAGD